MLYSSQSLFTPVEQEIRDKAASRAAELLVKPSNSDGQPTQHTVRGVGEVETEAVITMNL